MKRNYLDLGAKGERIAINYLKNKGYDVLDTNYFFKTATNKKIGEIDIIAKKDNILTFIEVKTTINMPNTEDFFCLERRVNKRKADKILLTARKWLMTKNISIDNLKWQLDIIGIIIEKDEELINNILHFENVFEDKKF